MSHSLLNRRTLVKGFSWAAPTLVATTAIPAYAASKKPLPPDLVKKLQGTVLVGKSCTTAGAGTSKMTFDGTKYSYPNGGLWVGGVNKNDVPANTKITFYIPISVGLLTWTPLVDNKWATPVQDKFSPQKPGYYAYVTYYSGPWTYHADAKAYSVDVPPNFVAKLPYAQCAPQMNVYSRRSVDIAGKNYILERGPVTL